MHTTHSNTQYTNESKRSEMGQVRQTQSRELLGLFMCVCIALCTIVAHNIAQNRPDNFPSCPPDNHHCSDDVYLREGGKGYTCSYGECCNYKWQPVFYQCYDYYYCYYYYDHDYYFGFSSNWLCFPELLQDSMLGRPSPPPKKKTFGDNQSTAGGCCCEVN